MSLLAPLFLAGILAVALPFWLHRLQTQSSEREPFSSAMLLETAEQQVHVKKKLKYLVLLALRVTLITLIALAFAKPFLTSPPETVVSGESGTHLVVVDTSASMDRAGVFSQALVEARRAIDAAPDDALLQVLAADSSLRVVSDLTPDKAAQRASMAGLAVSSLRADFGDIMIAADRYATSLPKPVHLHFISDFQDSAMPVRFSDLVPSRVSEFTPRVVGTGEPFNWSVEYLRQTADGLDAGLSGSGDRERVAEVELLVNDVVVDARGLSRTGPQVLRFDAPEYAEGENRVELRIITDDDFASDNQWFHVIDNKPPAAIPLITLDSSGLPVTYLSAALESAAGYRVELLQVGDFDARVLSRYQWAVIDDIGLVDEQLAEALTDLLQRGGNLLAFAGERAAVLESLPVSGHRHSPSSIVDEPGEFLGVGQVDTRHPVLSQTEGWHSVSVSRSMPLELLDEDEVLIRLENNEPFLIERRIGEGRLLLMPGHLDNRWSDLPIRPVFVSFVIEAARYLSGINEIARTYTTGATLPLGLAGGSSGQVVDPDGNRVLSLADTTREQQIKLNKPGIYEVYTSQGETIVAANIDPLESDLRKISQDVLDRWEGATDGQEVAAGASVNVETEQTIELWHWVLLILAIVVIGESILGNMYLRPRRQVQA